MSYCTTCSTKILTLAIVIVLFISVLISFVNLVCQICTFYCPLRTKRCNPFPEVTSNSTFIKKIELFVCHYIMSIGNIHLNTKKQDWKLIALSLVLPVQRFDKVKDLINCVMVLQTQQHFAVPFQFCIFLCLQFHECLGAIFSQLSYWNLQLDFLGVVTRVKFDTKATRYIKTLRKIPESSKIPFLNEVL